MRSVLTSFLVLSALTSGCSEAGPDYGPPPTCLAGEEGQGHWEYVPNEIREPGLIIDPDAGEEPEPSGPIAPSAGTMVWTGSRVLIWGEGRGASFDPETKRWEPLPTENGPTRTGASVWTGTHWLVVGGSIESGMAGAMYDPEGATWDPISMENAPRSAAVALGPIGRGEREGAIWTGSEMLFWTIGENEEGECVHQGALYNPETARWRQMSFEGSLLGQPWAPTGSATEPRCPTSLRGPLVWTGSELVVWALDVGDRSRVHSGVYNPATNSWRNMNLDESPLPRWAAYAAWTGSEVLVWGGSVGTGAERVHVVTGGFYDPSVDSWRQMSPVDAPGGADAITAALWTGQELLVPAVEDGCPVGARYDLATDTWSAMAPSPPEFYDRYAPKMAWTGSAALLWGGHGHLVNFDDGALYFP